MSKTAPATSLRSLRISLFVILWLCVFHYESLRYFYLNRWLDTRLPSVPYLFPPAGWIMFYRVRDKAGFAEVYGFRDGVRQRIDPHLILETRSIGFDNIRRNILSRVLREEEHAKFGTLLKRKFPHFDRFEVMYVEYPKLTEDPARRIERPVYEVSR